VTLIPAKGRTAAKNTGALVILPCAGRDGNDWRKPGVGGDIVIEEKGRICSKQGFKIQEYEEGGGAELM
jgi:hypothetical protein